LSAQQLNASASVPGSFTYSPSAGEVFAAGTHTLSATFTPNDSADVASAQATVTLTVAKATPIVTWQTPSSIQYGTPLSNAQLNAAALVPGSFTYTPAAGTVLTAGKQTLSVTFTPKDTLDYTTAQATVSLVVEGLDNFDSLMPMSFDDEPVRSEPADARRGGSTPSQQGKLETRFYKGATYEKGADGQWYLQKN
jgi:phosphoribosylformylglycinamidine (FGAM) synthase-like enzyme